jgi:hypothetical protein
MTTDERPTQPEQPTEVPAPTAAEMIAAVDTPQADGDLTPAGDPTQSEGENDAPEPIDGDGFIDYMIERAKANGATLVIVDDREHDGPPPPSHPARVAADLLDYFASIVSEQDTPEAREAFFQTITAPVQVSMDGPGVGSPEERAALPSASNV